mgnify:CR=1 FL=1
MREGPLYMWCPGSITPSTDIPHKVPPKSPFPNVYPAFTNLLEDITILPFFLALL